MLDDLVRASNSHTSHSCYRASIEDAIPAALITEQSLLAGEVPLSGIDDEIVNRVVIQVNWTDDGEDANTKVTLNDRDSQQVYGEIKSLDIDLPGVKLAAADDSPARWLALASRISKTFGSPRRRWTLAVPVGVALSLNLGDTVGVTHRLLRGYAAGIGVSNARGVVTGISIDPMAHAAEITVTHHGLITTGWNAALKVAEILSPTQVRVELGEYSNADLAWWVTGYAAKCIRLGDQDNPTAVTIDSIAGGGVVTTSPAHGLTSVGDYIIPAAGLPNALQSSLARLDADQLIA